MPFAEDLRKPKFPSLTRLITVKGKKLTEHPTIPTEEQNKSMAKFVDAMDLDQAGADDDGYLITFHLARRPPLMSFCAQTSCSMVQPD